MINFTDNDDDFKEDQKDRSQLGPEFEDIEVSTDYVRFDWAIFELFEISLSEAILMRYIHGLSKKTGWCYASQETLAKRLKVSRQTLYKYIYRLRYGLEFLVIGPKSGSIRLIKPSYKWEQVLAMIDEAHADKANRKR